MADSIITFINNSKKEKIAKELFQMLYNTTHCPIMMGEGFNGVAYSPQIDQTFPYQIGNKTIRVPIIVKIEKNSREDIFFGLDIIDNKLYINGNGGLTTEVLILRFIKQLYNKSVHLPLILSYGTCTQKKIVDRIFTKRYGLDKPIKINIRNKLYYEDWHVITNVFESRLGTLGDLFNYIHYSKNEDDTVILPNNVKCKIDELYDYICISFLATHKLLTNNNIFPIDMNVSNIFIHWLDANSYYSDKNIKDLKKIIYKVKNKYYKIKTFGFVIIFGDTGSFMIKIKEDVILIGYTPSIKDNFQRYSKKMNESHTNTDLIYNTFNFLTPRQFKNTVAYKILNSEPYCNFPVNNWKLLGIDISFLENKKSTLELLEFYYRKYGISKYEERDNNILLIV